MSSYSNITIYLKVERNTQLDKNEVFLHDIARLSCTDKSACARIKAICLYRRKHGEGERVVISTLRIIEEIQRLYPQAQIESLGETEAIVEWVKVKEEKGVWIILKILFVACISFFGAAFTIMAFHNDIGVTELFTMLYEFLTGMESDGFTELEVAYSLGLCTGIIVFFNHIGGRRITKDPTPIEVEMYVYEENVEKTLIETADREGKSLDVD